MSTKFGCDRLIESLEQPTVKISWS